MTRRPVTSKNVASVGWEDGDMEVEFHSGHIYRYHDVPEGEYRKLLGADSVGRHLNDNIAERYEMSRLR